LWKNTITEAEKGGNRSKNQLRLWSSPLPSHDGMPGMLCSPSNVKGEAGGGGGNKLCCVALARLRSQRPRPTEGHSIIGMQVRANLLACSARLQKKGFVNTTGSCFKSCGLKQPSLQCLRDCSGMPALCVLPSSTISKRKKLTLPPSIFAKVRFSSLNYKTRKNTSLNF
jgi:hypothetical protein